MQDRRIETRVEMFMGQELVYTVVLIDPAPAPSEENPYAEGGRCVADPRDARLDVEARPVRDDRTVRPTKPDYVRSFEASGALPACVQDRVRDITARVASVSHHFRVSGTPIPRRVREALMRFDCADLASVYDTGTLARIRHHVREHVRRSHRARVLA